VRNFGSHDSRPASASASWVGSSVDRIPRSAGSSVGSSSTCRSTLWPSSPQSSVRNVAWRSLLRRLVHETFQRAGLGPEEPRRANRASRNEAARRSSGGRRLRTEEPSPRTASNLVAQSPLPLRFSRP
jgi:hypothetical protein